MDLAAAICWDTAVDQAVIPVRHQSSTAAAGLLAAGSGADAPIAVPGFGCIMAADSRAS
jgi:hypothetical protein